MAEKSVSEQIADILNGSIQGAVVILDSISSAQAAREAAKVQTSIETSTAQSAAQQAASTNLAKNIVLVIGGTLGAILLFGWAKKALK